MCPDVTATDCGPLRLVCSETLQQMGFYRNQGQSRPHCKKKKKKKNNSQWWKKVNLRYNIKVSNCCIPEVLQWIVLSADRFMVLQLLKHNRTPTCWGGALLGLGRSQWTLAYLAVGQKAHKPWASLLPHCNQLWEPIQIANHELTGISGESRAELEYILLLHFFAISFFECYTQTPNVYAKIRQ